MLVFANVLAISQSNLLDSLVQQGIEYHDKGEYKKAIEKYEEALKIDANSSLVNYEISFSYLSLKDYKNAEKYSKIVIDANEGNQLHAYIVYGSALDMLGQPKKAIKAYEKALKNYDHYLLHYNLAITQFNIGETEKALESAFRAIEKNLNHASSHLLISNIMEKKGSRIKTVLPLYFFLLVEPNSSRSKDAFETLLSYLNYGVNKSDDKVINVSIPINKSSDSDFEAAEMMISLSKASNYEKENSDKTEMELFAENNNSIFTVLGELKKDNKGFWWDFYVPFFYKIALDENVKAYSYYIAQSSEYTEVIEWLQNNSEALDKLFKSINE